MKENHEIPTPPHDHIMPIFWWHLWWQALITVFRLHCLRMISTSNWLVYAQMLTRANNPVLLLFIPNKPVRLCYAPEDFHWETITGSIWKSNINPWTRNNWLFLPGQACQQALAFRFYTSTWLVCPTTSCTLATESQYILIMTNW